VTPALLVVAAIFLGIEGHLFLAFWAIFGAIVTSEA
jgi:hypothetical protein